MRAVKHSLVFLLAILLSPMVSAQDGPPLSLDGAVALAMERNERSAIADTAVAQAEARVGLARTAFLPRVDVFSTYRNDYSNPTDRTASASALLTQPIFEPRAFPLFRVARHERDAERLTATDTKRRLGFDAASAFLTTLSFEQVVLAARRRKDFAQTSLNDVRARFEAGLVSSNDVTRAELEVATADRAVAQAVGAVQSSRVELENLLNAPVGPLERPAELLEASALPPAIDLPSAQQRRTDIAARRADVEALRAFADIPRAGFLPSVGLTAQTRNINDGPITSRENDAFIGLSLNWSVFDSGVRRSQRIEREAQVRGAELELEADLRDVDRELRSAAVQLNTEQAALKEAIAARNAAQKNANETTILYREGLASALELADATQELFEAEVAEVTARYRMAVAYLALSEAEGLMPTDEGMKDEG